MVQKYPITGVRGRGLMVAAEFGGKDGGLTPEAGVAAAVTKACGKRGMLLLTSGEGAGRRGPRCRAVSPNLSGVVCRSYLR